MMTNLRLTMVAVAAAWALTAVFPEAQRGGQSETPAGDAGRGKALVESSGCFDCHRIDDRGSRLGPNLSSIRKPADCRSTAAGAGGP